MAIDKKLQIFDDEGNPVDYDILASDVKFNDGKDLPTKLAEMEEEIGEGGYTPPAGGIPKTDLAPSVQQTLDDVANKVDKVPGKGLSTNDYTDAEKTKLQNLPTADGLAQQLNSKVNASEVYSKSEVNTMVANAGMVKSVTINGQKKNPNQQTGDIDLGSVPTTTYIDNAVSQMAAQIEQQQLNVITGGTLSLWLDEDGESINIIAGEIPDIAAAPTITKQTNNDGTVNVSIASTEQGATIYYTTDGTTPTAESTQYNNNALTFNTAGTTTIKAIAVVEGKIPSVATETVEVVACTTPEITVANTSNTQCTVTATAGNGESVSLTVGEQTATGTGSASVVVSRGSTDSTVSASASASATGKLTATATRMVTIPEKVSHVWGAQSIGGKAADATVPIVVTASGVANATFFEEDGVVYWEADLTGKMLNNNGYRLYNVGSQNSSIFTAGIANVLTIEHIPESAVELYGQIFSGCTFTLFKHTGQASVTNINACLKLVSTLESVVLPSSITTTYSGEFTGLTSLKTVVAPGVRTLGNNTFKSCSNLESVTLRQLTTVGEQAFHSCSKLSFDNIDLTQVTTIGRWAFSGCTGKLKTPVFEKINSFGQNIFDNGTPTNVTINKEIADSSEAPTIYSDTFGTNKTYKIYVPAASVEFYKAATNWSSIASRIEAITSNS